MDEFKLNGKTILVTGASSGIGKETALLIHRYCARVILTGRDEARLNATRDQIAGQTDISGRSEENSVPSWMAIRADLTVEAEMDRLIDAIPPVDGVVHCAGIVGPLPVKFITQPEIDRMFSINYHVPVNLTGKMLRKKKIANHASLVFMSTIATRNPYFGGALYSGSKAALEAYSRTLALEMTTKGIRSNFIMAGLVDTPMIKNPSEEKMQAEALERYLKRYPLGIGKPGDVAGSILFFLSDASRWISGTSLILGGE